MSARRLFTICLVLAVAVLFALVPQVVAFAGQPVDPATLNPPVPPDFNPICEAVGSGTICRLAFSDPPVVEEGTGLICGSGASSFEVLISQNRSVEGKRHYDRDANLTQRHYREYFSGTFINPLTNAALPFDQSDTVIHNLAIPGDINSGTVTITGALRLHRQNGGIVLIDAGRAFLAAGVDWTLIKETGQHPFDAYYVFGDTSALQPICDALQ